MVILVCRCFAGIAVWRLVALNEGGDAMYVTYSDLIQIGILVVAVISMFVRRK